MTIQSVAIKLLRPTQIAVGQKLVRMKRKGLRALEGKPQELIDFILVHPIKVVMGPEAQIYVVDHHHLALALLKEGFKTSPVEVLADYSDLVLSDFWVKMAAQKWVHPFDGKGREMTVAEIPARLEDLTDDPYRSLATYVRMAGGYTKTDAPFVEFRWADYFRPLVKTKLIAADFKSAVAKAQDLAHLPGAAALPGYVKQKAVKAKTTSANAAVILAGSATQAKALVPETGEKVATKVKRQSRS